MTIGEYILERIEEEDLTLKDLDADTIDFFHQQWLIDPTNKLYSYGEIVKRDNPALALRNSEFDSPSLHKPERRKI